MWDEVTYLFSNFNGATVEVWEWMSNFTAYFTGQVMTNSYWDYNNPPPTPTPPQLPEFNPLRNRVELFLEYRNIHIYTSSFIFRTQRWSKMLTYFLMEGKSPFFMPGQYHDCWCPGGITSKIGLQPPLYKPNFTGLSMLQDYRGWLWD